MEFTLCQLGKDDHDRIWNFDRYIWRPGGAIGVEHSTFSVGHISFPPLDEI
jgi:hypothetical protein